MGINLTASLIQPNLNGSILDLIGKNISSILPGVFKNYSNQITGLKLQSNKLQVIENNWLVDLRNLTTLDLIGNSICAIHSDAFTGLNELKSLI